MAYACQLRPSDTGPMLTTGAETKRRRCRRLFACALLLAALAAGATFAAPTGALAPQRGWGRVPRLAAEAALEAPEEQEGSLEAVPAAFNLMKNVMGSGILSLSAGVAAFSANPRALWPATLLLAVPLGLLAAYTYYLVGQQCDRSRTSSYGEAWAKIINERSGSFISALVTMECFSGCVAYTMILGDALSLMLSPYLPAALVSRSSCILGITLLVLLPLSRLKDLAPLAKFSLVGTFGIVYTAGFMGLRCLQGAYAGPHPSFVGAVPPAPLQASAPWMPNVNMLILASIFSTAYMAHFNAPRMLQELKTPPAPPGAADTSEDRRRRRLQLFAKVVFSGYGAVILLSTFVMVVGFLTFGASAQGNILDSYSAKDPLAGLARVAVAASVLFGHPLQFVGFRDGVAQIAGQGRLPGWLLLASATGLALCVRDLGKVQAIKGALISVFLIFVAPSLMGMSSATSRLAKARHGTVVGLGMALAAAGVFVSATS